MIKRGKRAGLAIILSLMLCGCANRSADDLKTYETETSSTNSYETETETEAKTLEPTLEETDSSETTEMETTKSETKHDKESSTLSNETTAVVEQGETNENGVVDGQDVGPVETMAPVSDSEEKANPCPYLIKVNRLANTVTVYAKDSSGRYTNPVKAMVCSCGRAGHETPLGTFQLKERYAWRELFGNVYGMFSTRIQGSILFHSVPYYQPGNHLLEVDEFDKLGMPASLGCIRLQVMDAQWIFANCATGTYVVIYDSTDPGPLGKPTAPKIGGSIGVFRGWDPTDPNPGNPWVIYGDTVLTLSTHDIEKLVGTTFNPLAYVQAYNAYGGDVEVKMAGEVDFNKPGDYKVIYSVTNSAGKVISDYIVYHMVTKLTEPVVPTQPETTTENVTTAEETTLIESTEETSDTQVSEEETTAEATDEPETTVTEIQTEELTTELIITEKEPTEEEISSPENDTEDTAAEPLDALEIGDEET